MRMESNKKVKVHFSLRDDYGNKYIFKSEEKFDPDFETLDVFYMIKMFKRFLINAGYTKGIVDRVIYKDMSEEQEDDIAI